MPGWVVSRMFLPRVLRGALPSLSGAPSLVTASRLNAARAMLWVNSLSDLTTGIGKSPGPRMTLRRLMQESLVFYRKDHIAGYLRKIQRKSQSAANLQLELRMDEPWAGYCCCCICCNSIRASDT